MLDKSKVGVFGALMIMCATSGAMTAPTCGQPYTVQPGDSLSIISYQMDCAAAN